MDVRKKVFTISVVRHWHRLPRGVDAPSTETAKVSWMGSEHLMELWLSLFIVGGLDQMVCKGPC